MQVIDVSSKIWDLCIKLFKSLPQMLNIVGKSWENTNMISSPKKLS